MYGKQCPVKSLENTCLKYIHGYLENVALKVGADKVKRDAEKCHPKNNYYNGRAKRMFHPEDEIVLTQISQTKQYIVKNLHSILIEVLIRELQHWQTISEISSRTLYSICDDHKTAKYFMSSILLLPELHCLSFNSIVGNRKGSVSFDSFDLKSVFQNINPKEMTSLQEIYLYFSTECLFNVAKLTKKLKQLPNLSCVHLRSVQPAHALPLIAFLKEKISVKKLMIKASSGSGITSSQLESIEQLTHLELLESNTLEFTSKHGITVTRNFTTKTIGQLICKLKHLNTVNFGESSDLRGQINALSHYSELYAWMESNCDHGNCLLKKIKVWLGCQSWDDFIKLPSSALEKMEIMPFPKINDQTQGWLKFFLMNKFGVFSCVDGKIGIPCFQSLCKINGHLITNVRIHVYKTHSNNHNQNMSVLSIIHELPNLKRVSLSKGCVTPSVPFVKSRNFPFLTHWKSGIDHSGFLKDILAHSPILNTLTLFTENGTSLMPRNFRELFPTELPLLKKIQVQGSDLHIGEEEIYFIHTVAPGLLRLGDLSDWEISLERIQYLQKEAKRNNLLLSLERKSDDITTINYDIIDY